VAAETHIVTRVTPVTGENALRVRAAAVGLAVVMLLSLLALTPPARAASAGEVYAVPGSRTFHLEGRGFGHGIGMSQFGAEGMGRLGKGYRAIVDFYYPGTALDTVDKGREILVGLSGIVQSTAQGTGVVLPARDGLRISTRDAVIDWPARVGGEPVNVLRVVRGSGGLAVWAVSPAKAMKVKGGLSGRVVAGTAGSASDSRFAVSSSAGTTRVYRGQLEIVSGSSMQAVNRLLLEDYLRSVVSSEVPSSWTAAALRAQAVAARSYALLAQQNARAANRVFDICDTTYCQVYSPIGAESGPEVKAVRATSGEYLKDAGSPVLAMFSSANGGYSVAGSRSYLVAQRDPYDGVVTGTANWGHSWTDSVNAGTLENAWPQIGSLQKLKVLGRDGNGDFGGRVMSVGLVGSKSTITISADSFRWATGVKSTWWTVTNVEGGGEEPAQNVRVDRRDRSAVVRWGAPNTDRRVKAYRVTVSSVDKTVRTDSDARRVRVKGLTNGEQYRAKVAPVYRSGPGPKTATPVFVPTSAYSYFQSLKARRVVDRGDTTAAQRGGVVTAKVFGGDLAPASGTRAVAVRISAETSGNAGRVQVWPCGVKQRAQVAVTYQADGAGAGLATVPAGDGRLCTGATTNLDQLSVDLLGFYTSSGAGTSAFRPVPARRLVNSVTGTGWSSGRLESGSPRTVQIAGRSGVPQGARTVLVSIGLVEPTETATVSVAGPGTPVSLGAVVRAPAKAWRTGTTVARLDADGRLPLRLTRGKSHVQVDVLGWFRRQQGERAGRFRALAGHTVLDAGMSLDAGTSRSVRVRGGDTGVPGGASAVLLQALARSDASGYLTVLPAGSSANAQPLLAFDRKGTQRTQVVVPVGDDGRITVTAKGADAGATFRVVGWYS
jgi:stage II sporulation protein D